MKVKSAITIALIAICGLTAGANYKHVANNEVNTTIDQKTANEDFEKAVQIIKKYEGLHQPKHWPLIGYGHLVQKGEKYSRSKALSEKEAEALLRKDLLKNCAVFRQFGADSLILGVLAYNIGSGATLRSSVTRKLKAGDRNIYDSYVAHSKYRGKTNPQIKRRRIEEFETLFIKETQELNAEPTIQVEEVIQENVETPRKLTNLHTPAMQYPLHLTPQLRSADQLPIASVYKTGAKQKKTIRTHNTLTACILKSQQYYWL